MRTYSKEQAEELEMLEKYAVREGLFDVVGIRKDAPANMKKAYERYRKEQKKRDALFKKTGKVILD